MFLPDGSAVPLALPPPVLGLTAAVLLRCLWDTAGLGPEGCAAMALWLVSGLLGEWGAAGGVGGDGNGEFGAGDGGLGLEMGV